MTELGMTTTTSLGFDEAEAAIRAALADQGFGVLTEIDIAATLKEKIDVDRAPYKILGACKPTLANEALNHDESIGMLLPCNVTLSEKDNGTEVSIVDPELMLGMTDDAEALAHLATEAKRNLAAALAALP